MTGHRPLDIDDDDIYLPGIGGATPIHDDDDDDEEDEDEAEVVALSGDEATDDEDEDEDAPPRRRSPRPIMALSAPDGPPLAGVGDMIDPDEAARENDTPDDTATDRGGVEDTPPDDRPPTLDTPDSLPPDLSAATNSIVLTDEYSVPAEAVRAARHAEGRAFIADDGSTEAWQDMYGVDEEYARMVRATLDAAGEDYHDDD